MLISKELKATELVISLDGRLDTSTAPQLEAELKNALEGVKTLIIDMANLVYISSAGLRVLLKAQKVMNKQGGMTVKNVSQEIMDIFEVTGFSEILNIEQ